MAPVIPRRSISDARIVKSIVARNLARAWPRLTERIGRTSNYLRLLREPPG